MSAHYTSCGIILCAALAASCRSLPPPPAHSFLREPGAPEVNLRAPDLYRVRLDTTRGVIVIEVHRDWAPRGADRFYNLVRAGYYDDSRFFRVIGGKWAQFGIAGDPETSAAWRHRTFPDDPRVTSNQQGTVAFAFAVSNGRTTEVFINLRDNAATHDAQPFVPFGRVIAGLDQADRLNAEYGEAAGGGIRGGRQAPLFEAGNAYLDRNFPRLDRLVRATISEPPAREAGHRVSLLPAQTASPYAPGRARSI